MINANMRTYPYYLYGDANEYGQPMLSTETQGTIKMSLYTLSQRVQDNIAYAGAEYIGLTHADVNDKYVIQLDSMKLKVLYVSLEGRIKQVFMSRM